MVSLKKTLLFVFWLFYIVCAADDTDDENEDPERFAAAEAAAEEIQTCIDRVQGVFTKETLSKDFLFAFKHLCHHLFPVESQGIDTAYGYFLDLLNKVLSRYPTRVTNPLDYVRAHHPGRTKAFMGTVRMMGIHKHMIPIEVFGFLYYEWNYSMLTVEIMFEKSWFPEGRNENNPDDQSAITSAYFKHFAIVVMIRLYFKQLRSEAALFDLSQLRGAEEYCEDRILN